MLIGKESEPFDSPDFSFELKLDGVRCLAYLDDARTDLFTRNGRRVLEQFPELSFLHRSVRKRCIIDGELVIFRKGLPDFEAIKERALATDNRRIARLSAYSPVLFVVFDILYEEKTELIATPFLARRDILQSVVEEDEHLVIARTVERDGIAFFNEVQKQGLEGTIAKRNDSPYRPGQRTTDWIKCKNILDDDFIICGYISNKSNTVSIVLGQYDEGGSLVYRGHAVLGRAQSDFTHIESLPETGHSPFTQPLPKGNENVIWVELKLVCRVSFIDRTEAGLLRHPHYEGLRIDKLPQEIIGS